MTDGAPAPLTQAERVALTIAAQTLSTTVENLWMQWEHLKETHPEQITPEVRKGFKIALHWMSVRAENIERNAKSGEADSRPQ